jgi:drug/metabolite transporter (DMT)-like permease
MRATIDERRSSFDEPPERVPEGEELSQPLLDDKSLQGPEGQNVPAQTASLAPGVETADRHLPVLNIPHADGSTEVAATASGFPRSQEEEGSEPSADENEYLFAVPRATRERRSSFWDNPLPSGVSDVNFDIGPKSAPEAGDSDSELQFNVTVTRRTPLVAWVMLIGALLSVSITGWAIKEQKGPSALMKCTWRSQATSLFVLPLCLYFVWKDDLLYRPFLSYQMKQAVYASLGYLLFNGTFLWALDHTSSALGFLLNNLHSVLIVFYRAMIGNPVQLMEALGAVVGLTGATLVCLDSQLSSENARSSASWTGDIVAAIGSTFGALYFVAAKETRPKMNISIFALICHLSNLPFFVAFTYLDAWLFPHISPWPSIDRDPTTGVFGWLTTKQIPSELAISLVSTLMGTTGYVLVMRYVEPLAISTTTLLEPVAAAAIGVVFVGESFPGGLTMFAP